MTPHFSNAELTCSCGCGLLPSLGFMQHVERLRMRFAKPMKVTSGARCPAYNATVSSTDADGPHTKDAIDFGVSGKDAQDVVKIALDLGFTGIGIHQRGPHTKRFVHVDRLPNAPGQPRPWIWSY